MILFSFLLLLLLQLQRPRERLCLFVLLVIPPSSSYNETRRQSRLPVASWTSFTVATPPTLTPPGPPLFPLSDLNPRHMPWFSSCALLFVKIPPIAELPWISSCLYQSHLFVAPHFVKRDFCCNMFLIFLVANLNEELDVMDPWDIFFFSSFFLSFFLHITVAWKKWTFFSLCCAEGCAKHARPGSGWRCCVGVAAHSIPLECWYLHPCVTVLMYCSVGKTLVYEQDLRPALFKSGDECRGCERSRTSVHLLLLFFCSSWSKTKNKKDAPPKTGALHLALIAALCTGSPSHLIRLLFTPV